VYAHIFFMCVQVTEEIKMRFYSCVAAVHDKE